MNVINNDYEAEDITLFLKEEFERIIAAYPTDRGGNLQREARALGIWFLHQEAGLDYEEAMKFVLDDSDDGGVDFILIDNINHEILVGQVEYDSSDWSKIPANVNKAIETFREFNAYLDSCKLPDRLNDASKSAWRNAFKSYKNERYKLRYVFVTPKYLTSQQEEKIKEKTGFENYDFFTHDMLIERGQEFLDGQTGMGSFYLNFKGNLLKIDYDFGSVTVLNVDVKEIDGIVKTHKTNRKLKSLFASNVRSYLNIKKRSKEIAQLMRNTLKNEPNHFLICNNGIAILCSEAVQKSNTLFLKRASITNGCQTAMNINRYFEENPEENPTASVLVTVIELKKDSSTLASEIARSRNNQNPVDNRDLMSNDPLLVTLHHRLSADKLYGSEKKYYLLRKQGEKQVLLTESKDAKGRWLWVDAEKLARCIAAVLRQRPDISQQGANSLFGEYFRKIFPSVRDPSHSRCKYAWWLKELVYESYDGGSRWKGIRDSLISKQKDFKGLSEWTVSSLIHSFLSTHFSFNEHNEKKFVEKCEKWYYHREELEDFEEISFEMVDDAFRLLHAISKTLLGKRLPRAREPYTTYDNLFKGPGYEYVLAKIRRGEMSTYKDRLKKSMNKFINYLKNN